MNKKLTHFILGLICLSSISTFALDKTVAPGASIQTAIDQVSTSGGGIVTCKAGTHTITSTLLMKSNVTLQGEPNFVSTIKCTLDINMIEGSDSKGGLKNMTIQNITIFGVQTVNSGGIQITASTTDNENIKLLNVRCYETGWGVHVKGCVGLLIEDCDFSRNGALSKEGFAHNCYIRRVTNGYVRRSKFNNSITANGINISYSENINVMDCQMIGNYFRGVRSAVSVGFLVQNCIIKDNGDIGILANSETGGFTTTNCDWQNNCVENNRIGLSGGASGVCKNNNSFNNVEKDYSVSGSLTQSGNTSDKSKYCMPNTCNGTIMPSLIEAECFTTMSGIQTEACSEGGLNVGYINSTDWLSFENVDLDNAKSFEARVSTNVSGSSIEIRIDSLKGKLIGTLNVYTTNAWQNWAKNSTNLSSVSGMHTVYLVFKGGTGYLMNLNWFGFSPTTILVTDLENQSTSLETSIYPNPSTTKFYIQSVLTLTYQVMTSRGELVLSGVSTTNNEAIDISRISSGIYFVKMTDEAGNSVVSKLIKE